jgi:Helix-turn-helix.
MIARDAGIDRSQLCDIELGKSEAKIGTLLAIAGALGKTISQLFEGLG